MAAKIFKHKPITLYSNTKDCSLKGSKFKEKEDEQTDTKPCFISHLQPEVLPMELMKTLLLTRGGGEDIKNEVSSDIIISLFYKHITPKPQRLYKQNRKWKMITQNQNKKQADHVNDPDYTLMKSKGEDNVYNLGVHDNKCKESSTDRSRLKRPIICTDMERKTIKLSSSSSSSSSLDRIKIIDKRTPTKSTSESDHTTEEQHQQNVTDAVTSDFESTLTTGHKKIKLDRTHAATESKTISNLEGTKEKKKNLISWP